MPIDLKLEAVVIPVSDVDRAKKFYAGLGWRLDADFPFDNGVRAVQFTPPGSECSIQFGTKLTNAAPGSAKGLYLIVSDIAVAHDELVALGVKVSEVFHAKTSGRSVSARRQERSHKRPRARPRQLPFLCDLQRSGRQRLAAAGGHNATAWPDRGCQNDICIRGRPGQRISACGGGARRARKTDRRPARCKLA